jgi:hypothetical protein
MNVSHIEQALLDCEHGKVQIQARKSQDAFLYKKKWYPIKAIGIRAYEIANERPPANTHEMTMRLAEQLGYLRFAEIDFSNRKPVPLADTTDILVEVKQLANLLNELMK